MGKSKMSLTSTGKWTALFFYWYDEPHLVQARHFLEVSKSIVVRESVWTRAKKLVAENQVVFFDFFRDSAFGFVMASAKGGYYTGISMGKKGELIGVHCQCKGLTTLQACEHAMAIFLKVHNYPLAEKYLSSAFDGHPMVQFLQAVGRPILQVDFLKSKNPHFRPYKQHFDERFLSYLGFVDGKAKVLEKDQNLLESAKLNTRDVNEKSMIRKGFPTPRTMFEDSSLYSVAKMLFYLEKKAELETRVNLDEDHQVTLRYCSGKREYFSWSMPIDTFMKGIQKHWEEWMEMADFQVRKQGVALIYRIHFNAEGALEIEPQVEVAENVFVPLAELQVPKCSNLFYHSDMGYFRITTGLTPFEMSYSEVGCAVIQESQLNSFFKEHREVLERLDRRQMDESLFDELSIELFQRYVMKLLDFKQGHFLLSVMAELGDLKFGLLELYELYHSGKRFVKLGSRLFDTMGMESVYLRQLCAEPTEEVWIPVWVLFRVLTYFKDRMQVVTNAMTEEVFAQLQLFQPPSLPSLSHTRLSLRTYQERGYEWLYFLKSYGLGGLLCDQMGLGKTHQGMAMIAGMMREQPQGRALVVAPTSVLYHWKQKLEQFCPELKVQVHHGTQRDSEDARNAQVLVSSYTTLRNDVEEFHEHQFDLILFDEIQNLKNKTTKNFRALSRLHGHCKIGLTGTPIENSPHELKNLMDLVLPGYLGTDASFHRHFLTPIQKYNDAVAKEKLKAVMHPFLLRRSKKEVLTELPEKSEDILRYELTKFQKELYEQVRFDGTKEIQMEEDKGPALKKITHIFQLIDKLKRICNHPALYFETADYKGYPSTKWEMFTELLHETLDAGEKMVIFTQYLGMVEMFESYLNDNGIEFAKITGSVRDREAQQGRFQQDSACKVFIGTIMAAGVGIDLTEGSVLVHYDRWWNPAREEQATDRIHRIGQKRSVQIYKFVGMETVEERVDSIINRKRKYLEDLIEFDSQAVGKLFGVNELLEILS